MHRILARPVLVASLLLGAIVTVAVAQKPADKTKDKARVVKDIMMSTHTKTGPLNKVGQAVKGGKWDDAVPLAQQLVKAGDDLAKAKPPAKGSPASWTKLVKQYQADTKAVLAAVEKKNPGDFKEAMETLNASCRTCHTVHK